MHVLRWWRVVGRWPCSNRGRTSLNVMRANHCQCLEVPGKNPYGTPGAAPRATRPVFSHCPPHGFLPVFPHFPPSPSPRFCPCPPFPAPVFPLLSPLSPGFSPHPVPLGFSNLFLCLSPIPPIFPRLSPVVPCFLPVFAHFPPTLPPYFHPSPPSVFPVFPVVYDVPGLLPNPGHSQPCTEPRALVVGSGGPCDPSQDLCHVSFSGVG